MNHGSRLTLRPTASLTPQTTDTTVNGSGVDLYGAEAALVYIQTGTFTGTSPTAKYKIQESDDNSAWSTVSDDNLIGATGNSSGIAILTAASAKVDYVGTSRYVRVIVSAVTGTTPVIPIAATVILSHLRHTDGQPV